MKKRLLALVIGFVLLTASGTSALADNAANTMNHDFVYQDPETGDEYHNVTAYDAGSESYTHTIIMSNNDGEWLRLDKRIAMMQQPNKGTNPRVFMDYVRGTVSYDPQRGKLVDTPEFIPSPDGKWAYLYVNDTMTHKGWDGEKAVGAAKSLMIQNRETGAVRELYVSTSSMSVAWMKDGRLLVGWINAAVKQREILAYTPATGKSERLLLGKLYGLDYERNLIEYVKNEPTRTPWIYDIATKKSRPAGNDGIKPLPSPQPLRPVPDGLDWASLPERTLELEKPSLYTIKMDGKTVGLPFAFLREGRTWLPVREIADGFGITVTRSESGGFMISKGNASVALDGSNSIVFKDRLYIQIDPLKALGGKGIYVAPIPLK